MVSAISSGLAGIQRGIQQMDRSASAIARMGATTEGGPGELANNMVQLMQARNDVKANVAVVKTADDVLGTLIDTRA